MRFKFLSLTVLVIVTGLVLSGVSQRPPAECPAGSVTISTSGAIPSRNPDIAAISIKEVFVVYEEWEPPDKPPDIFVRKCDFEKAICDSAVNLSSNPGRSRNPAIAVSGASDIFVVWEDETPGNKEIFFRRSTDKGATWEPTRNLSNNAGSSENPALTAFARTVLVAWDDNSERVDGVLINPPPSVDKEIVLRASEDRGKTFQSAVNVSNNDAFIPSERPALAMPSPGQLGEALVIWKQLIPYLGVNGIFLRQGSPFSTPQLISMNSPRDSDDTPSATVRVIGGVPQLLVVFQRGIGMASEIFFVICGNLNQPFQPATCSPPANVSATLDEESRAPSITADIAGKMSLAWENKKAGQESEILVRSGDFFRLENASNTPTIPSRNPAIKAVNLDVFIVVWEEGPAPEEICGKKL